MRVLTSIATRRAILGNIIDSMSSQVIVLDADARIIMVNQAFLDFGRDNGASEPEDSVGANYLKTCIQGAQKGATEAGSIGIGLQRVLNGQVERFTTVYDCHSPLERRWFRVTITRWEEGGLHGAVLVHDDMTPMFLAERAILRAAGRGPPRDQVITFADMSGPMAALAEVLSHLAGKQVIVDIDAGLEIMADIEALMSVVANLALDAARAGPVRLEGIRQGRRIILRIGGWRQEIDVDLLDQQMRDLGGRAVLEMSGAPNAPLVDLVLMRARPPTQGHRPRSR